MGPPHVEVGPPSSIISLDKVVDMQPPRCNSLWTAPQCKRPPNSVLITEKAYGVAHRVEIDP